MKSIKFSEFLFYKKINSILNIAFILIMVMSNIFVLVDIFFINKGPTFQAISVSLFSISMLFFTIYILYFFLYFYKNFYDFFIKIKKDFLILFFTMFVSISIGIVCLAIVYSFPITFEYKSVFRKVFFVTSPFIVIFAFVGITINVRIFSLWQSQKNTDSKTEELSKTNKIDDNLKINEKNNVKKK